MQQVRYTLLPHHNTTQNKDVEMEKRLEYNQSRRLAPVLHTKHQRGEHARKHADEFCNDENKNHSLHVGSAVLAVLEMVSRMHCPTGLAACACSRCFKLKVDIHKEQDDLEHPRHGMRGRRDAHSVLGEHAYG